jgi:hypothetical protein
VPATTTARPVAPTVVAVFGDSVADWLLRDATPSFARADVTLVDAAVEGCDGAANEPPRRHSNGALATLPEGCDTWPTAYPRTVERDDLSVDVAVLVPGGAPLLDHEIAGVWLSPCIDMQWYLDDVAERVSYLRRHVGAVVLAMPAWGGEKAAFLASTSHLERTGCIRDELARLAVRAGVPVVDLAELLCPAGPAGTCTDLRATDGVHVDAEDAPAVLDWLLGRVLALARS